MTNKKQKGLMLINKKITVKNDFYKKESFY